MTPPWAGYDRQPWEHLVNWGQVRSEPPDPAIGPAGERLWVPPEAPPWADRPSRKPGPPGWAIASIVIGLLLISCCAGCLVLTGAVDANRPAAGPVAPIASPVPKVEVTGICHTRVVGSYGLVASVQAHNPTDSAQAGSIWVRWPVTGERARVYSLNTVLASGGVREFHVDEPIDADRWMRLGLCDYGWTPAPPGAPTLEGPGDLQTATID
jgi:hypothetical protein